MDSKVRGEVIPFCIFYAGNVRCRTVPINSRGRVNGLSEIVGDLEIGRDQADIVTTKLPVLENVLGHLDQSCHRGEWAEIQTEREGDVAGSGSWQVLAH